MGNPRKDLLRHYLSELMALREQEHREADEATEPAQTRNLENAEECCGCEYCTCSQCMPMDDVESGPRDECYNQPLVDFMVRLARQVEVLDIEVDQVSMFWNGEAWASVIIVHDNT